MNQTAENIIGGEQHLDERSQWYFTLRFFLIMLVLIWAFGIALNLGMALVLPLEANDEMASLFAKAFVAQAILSPLMALLASYGWSILYRKAYTFTLAEQGVEQQWGVINTSWVTIGYNRIQNVNIRRNLIVRMFGLATIEIQTAGNNNTLRAEGVIPGLRKERAQSVRDFIVQRATGT